jgi:hypothetical protein
MHWFKRTDENLHVPGLPDSIHYNGDHHISYNVILSLYRPSTLSDSCYRLPEVD